MKFAISIPNAFSDIRQLCDVAREAEDSGWDGFFLWDHVNAFDGPTIDPWVALAAIATVTSRVRIGAIVTPLPRRRPWIVARQAVTLDHLSRGRVIVGVGLGWPADREFSDLGEDADERVRAQKLDESLAIIDGLWRGEPLSFSGKYYNIENVTFLPRPVQQPRIPIWVAGMWPNHAPFRRAARWDGVVPMKRDLSHITTDDVAAIKAYVARHREGTRPHDFVIGGNLPLDEGQARDEAIAFARAGVTWWVEGAYRSYDELHGKARRKPPIAAM